MQFRDRVEARREFATELASDREKRGDAGQLARLSAAGRGHCKEAGKLRKRLGKDPLAEEEGTCPEK